MAPKNSEYIELAHQRAAEKKTHVSFPQLKYPSLRDEGLKHPVQWLEGKSMDDGAEGLWRVHGGLYDLTDFINLHPGGAEWLELTKGTDITEAFECHHITNTATKMLEKYYVKNASTPRNSPFTFEDDGFYRTLKRDAVEVLKTIPKHKAKLSDMVFDGLVLTLAVSSVASLWFKNVFAVYVSYLLASLCMTGIANVGHNYLHRRNNWRMYLFNLTLWSYRDFRVLHALSHHLYPNTLMDLEISSLEPVLMWNPRKKPYYAKLSIFIEAATYPFMFLYNFFKKFSLNFTKKNFFTEHYRWHDLIGWAVPLWMYVVSGVPFTEAFYMWLWINCTASLFFFIVATNAAHHHPDIFKDGDQVRSTTVDWGLHELEAVMDRTDVHDDVFRVILLFGHHAMHHMFPTLDHAYLSYLYPMFLKHVEAFKGNFRMKSSFELFLGQLRAAAKEDPNVLDDDKTD